MASEQPPRNLRPPSRYITTHSPDGHAISSTNIDNVVTTVGVMQRAMDFMLMYNTSNQPVEMLDTKDITSYAVYLANLSKIIIRNESVRYIVDFRLGYTSLIPRTQTLRMCILIEGEIELTLDSGVTRRIKRGDVLV